MTGGRVEFLGFAGIGLLLVALLLRALVEGTAPVSLALGVLGIVLLVAYLFRAGSQIERFTGRRSTREGSGVVGLSLLVAGSLVLVNVIASRVHWEADLTEDALFTVAPETEAAIARAAAPVEVFLFYPEGTADGDVVIDRLRPVLESAARSTRRFRWEIIDPHREPLRALEFDLRGFAGVVRVGERFTTFQGATEEALLAALLEVTRGDRPAVSFLRGHGEVSPTLQGPEGMVRAATALRKRGYTLWQTDLREPDALDDSTGVLVIAGADTRFRPEEEDSLLAFLERGGRLLWLVDPARKTRLSRVAQWLGLTLEEGILADPTLREPQVLVPREYGNHPIIRPLRDRGLWVVLPGVMGLEVSTDRVAGREALLRSGRQTVRAGHPGSVPRTRVLAAAVARATAGPPARAVVVGDVDWVTDALFESYGNGDLFLAAVQWLAEKEDAIALRPRARTDRPVVISRQQGRSLVVLLVVVLPLALVGWGGAVWWRRR